MPSARAILYYSLLWAYTTVAALVFHSKANAQTVSNNTSTDNAIFYEVSGNGLSSPSYMFGTFHLLTQSYVESLPGVMKKFGECKQVVGEMVIDSSIALKMASAITLKGTTLDKVIDKQLYDKTNAWLKELSGYDLSLLNSYSPMAINVMLLQFMQIKYFPTPSGEKAMDIYFQEVAKKKGMKVLGFETVDEQITALFNQFTEKRQVEMLADFVNKKDSNLEEMKKMINLYKTQNLPELAKLMYDKSYNDSEIKVMLYDRNSHWMTELPAMMKSAPTFVAVGALHLAGEKGLVQQLRKLGYTVTPISLKS